MFNRSISSVHEGSIKSVFRVGGGFKSGNWELGIARKNWIVKNDEYKT
jgi:hypothetical protein